MKGKHKLIRKKREKHKLDFRSCRKTDSIGYKIRFLQIEKMYLKDWNERISSRPGMSLNVPDS